MYAALSVVFVGCVAVQVFLAGLAVFVDPARWAWHSLFVHLFQVVPLLMLAVAWAARLPRWTKAASGLFLALLYAMYVTANIGVLVPTASAVHPVLAMVVAYAAIRTAHRSVSALAIGAPPHDPRNYPAQNPSHGNTAGDGMHT